MKQIILLSILAILGIKTYAHDIEVKNADGTTIYYNWINNKTELAVTYYGSDYRSNQTPKYSGNIVISEVVIYNGKSYNVTSIGSNAFWHCSGLTSINIPNSVKEIGLGAFSSCTGLTFITIPNSITKLEGKYHDGVFSGCTNLISINIPKSVTSIGNYVFSGCKSLTSINIPNSVTSIGDYAFSGCLSLSSIEIPNSIISIGDRVFKNCEGLISITFGNGLESIGICAFSGCNNLKKVIVKDIAAWCNINFKTGSYSNDDYSPYTSNPLYYSHHLYSDENTEIKNLVIPNGVTSIGIDAFKYCYSLESVEFHCQEVYSWFNNNPYILEVTFGDEVTSIGDNAFRGCKGLTTITIPKNIKYIGNYAFYDCNLIKVIWLPSEYQKVNGIININSIIYPHLDTAFEINGIKYVIVNPSTRTCDAIDCIKNKTVENITVDNNVSYRGLDFKIEKCKAIFVGNQFIKNVKLNFEGDTGNYQFYGCKNLEKVELGDQITSIGSSVFENCSSLNSVTIPNSVTSIADKTFINCSNLKSISIPNSVTSIGNSTFQNCTSLTSVTISNNITSINYRTFYGCAALTSVNIPEFVTSISDYAFYGCSGLTTINIPNSVTSIGELAFSGCTSLSFGSIGENVSSIGSQAFYGCTGITKLICKAMTPPYCNYKALYDIDKWNCTLSVPEGSITAYQQADQWKDFFFIDNNITKINSMTNELVKPTHIYDLNGKKLKEPNKGINIIGRKKVVVK